MLTVQASSALGLNSQTFTDTPTCFPSLWYVESPSCVINCTVTELNISADQMCIH